MIRRTSRPSIRTRLGKIPMVGLSGMAWAGPDGIRDTMFNARHGHDTRSIVFRKDRVHLGRAGAELFFRDVPIENGEILNGHLPGIATGEGDGRTIRSGGPLDGTGIGAPQLSRAP
ncbi:hypothetical protein ACN9JG_21650 (plasmid) [Cereibacter azotoformans]|uniref:hypothetical protein n=1 Tax=Cereibacter azotoformans TaxID=43057 RepID=UPI003B20D6BB